MKKIFLSLLATSAIAFYACNNNSDKNSADGHDMKNMNKDTTLPVAATGDKALKVITITYPGADAKATASIKEIVDHYLHIKNALANDNGKEAANGGKEMEIAISKLDKSLLTSEQKKAYDEMEDAIKEDAEHIGKNGDNIKHQREHFASMSEDVYGLVKSFGGGRPLYHDHCPMYNEDKGGAMWISELKEVKNPYLGAEMPTCGSVEEVIK